MCEVPHSLADPSTLLYTILISSSFFLITGDLSCDYYSRSE